MANTHFFETAGLHPRSFPRLFLVILITLIQVCLGSMLGISTALVFGSFALVVLADMPINLAITAVALGMNAMLFSMILLGGMLPDRQF